MSKTTTAIPTIKGLNNITEATINKLYANVGIPQPMSVVIKKKPSFYDRVFGTKEITLEEVRHNTHWTDILKSMTISTTDIIVEEVQLTEYISINFNYNKLN